MNNQNDIVRMKSMMKSCFAYHSLWKDNKYLTPYIDTLGLELFNETYDTYKLELENTYTIKSDVYTSSDDCSYNELIEK